MELCKVLISINKKIYLHRFKIQKKLRKKKYKKNSYRILKAFLTTKEYIVFFNLLKEAKKRKRIDKKNTKKLLKQFLKFDCTNALFRHHYLGFELYKNYEYMSEQSFFKHEKDFLLEKLVVDMISK